MTKWYPGIWRYNPPGGAFGRNGIPDFFFLYKGIFIAIEVKSESGKPTDLQIKQLKVLAENGAIAAIVVGCDSTKMLKIKSAIDAKLKVIGEI